MKPWTIEVASSHATDRPSQPASARTVWHVRLRGGNGEIVMSTETYATKRGAHRAASRIFEAARDGFALRVEGEPKVARPPAKQPLFDQTLEDMHHAGTVVQRGRD